MKHFIFYFFNFLAFVDLFLCQEFRLDNWMKSLDESLLISQISIPGTHDSGTKGMLSVFECQDWTIPEQLNNGIRYLDFRMKLDDDFTFRHAFQDSDFNFFDIMIELKKFLDDHPSEFILIRIKQEWDICLNFTDKFDKAFFSDPKYSHYFFHPYPKSNYLIPTVKEMRKKIFIFSDFADKLTIANTYRWGKVNVQDDYNHPSEEKKKYAFQNQLWAAIHGKSHDTFFLNHASATSYLKLITPRQWAQDHMIPWIKSSGFPSGRIGTIIFDFPDSDVISLVIRNNFNLSFIDDSGSIKFLYNEK